MILFHPKKNIGRTVTINGKQEVISYIGASKEFVRIESEKNGPTVHDYYLNMIGEASVLTVSVNGGDSWMDIPVLSDHSLT